MIKKVDKEHFFNVRHTLCWSCSNGYAGKCSYIDIGPPVTDENLTAEINHLGIMALCWKPSNVNEEKHNRKSVGSLFKVVECPRYKEEENKEGESNV